MVTIALMIWPPANASSTRTELPSANGDHLREDAVDGVWMDECNLQSEQPAAGRGVDQLGARGLEGGERDENVLYLVGDVVHPRAARGEEPADRRLGAKRRQQLDPAHPDAHRRRLDALVGHRVAVLDPRAEQPLVGGDGLVEVGD